MISKDQIEKAKYSDLPTVLTRLGVDLIAEGRGYHIREHDSLKLFRHNGVWLYKWWSRQAEVGDGIDYLRRYHGFSFEQAVETLAGQIILNEYKKNYSQKFKVTPNQWRVKSERLIRFGQSYLLSAIGRKIFSFLVQKRGLKPETIKKHNLGWLPVKRNWPSKILIPCYDNQGALKRIRFRIDNPIKERYRISQGSDPDHPYALGIHRGMAVIIVESELDALLLAQEAGDRVGVLGLGTTGIKFSALMIRFLNEKIPKVLISLDNDPAGRNKTANLLKKLTNAVPWSVPENLGKDPGEAWKKMNIRSWVESGITQTG